MKSFSVYPAASSRWTRWWTLSLLFLGLAYAQAATVPGPLVDTAWLVENRDDVVVLDVRGDVKSFAKRPKGAGPVNPCGPGKKGDQPLVVAGHIPGAVLVPWKNVTSKRKTGGAEIKVLVPTKEDFDKLMQKSGVNNDSAIVITSKGQTPGQAALAARLYWTLKYFGHDNVALLNGGTAQWIIDKQKVRFGNPKPEAGNFQATGERSEILASMDDVKQLSMTEGGDEQLVDVRGKDVYLGLTYASKFVPPQGKGHIPGASNFPVSLVANTMGPAATFYTKEQIQQVANLVGIDTSKPTTTFCNTGVYASLGWFALHEVVGNEKVRMYDGSMHEWASAGNPVASMKIE